MNYKMIISYDGSKYYGYSKQLNLNTIQSQLENSLYKLFNQKISTFCSGRTDRYVHAIGQTISFKSDKLNINPISLIKALNSTLPNDIRILDCCEIDEKFHARFSAKSKTYIYKLNMNSEFDIFNRNYEYQYNKLLKLELFDVYKQFIIGTHNFLSFSTSEITNTIRTIFDFNYTIDNNHITFKICGNGFLRNMVRMIIGVFLDLSEDKIHLNQIKDYFDNPKKGKAVRKVNGCGLYLLKVDYE